MGSHIAVASAILSGLAFILHLAVFVFYIRQVARGKSRPNAATWAIWAFVASLNCLSFFFMSEDWVKALQPLAGSLACVGTFLFALLKGKLTRLNRLDKAVLGIGLLAALAWWVFRSAGFANSILQIAFTVSFVPTIRDVWQHPDRESPGPWLLWGTVYAILIAVVLMRWTGQPIELLYPLISMVTHSSVGLVAWLKRPG